MDFAYQSADPALKAADPAQKKQKTTHGGGQHIQSLADAIRESSADAVAATLKAATVKAQAAAEATQVQKLDSLMKMACNLDLPIKTRACAQKVLDAHLRDWAEVRDDGSSKWSRQAKQPAAAAGAAAAAAAADSDSEFDSDNSDFA